MLDNSLTSYNTHDVALIMVVYILYVLFLLSDVPIIFISLLFSEILWRSSIVSDVVVVSPLSNLDSLADKDTEMS